MRQIEFKCRGQRLSRARTDGEGPIVRGTRGYLQARFDVDGTWEGLRLVASFFDAKGREHAVEVSDGACQVPDEVTGGKVWRVALVGAKGQTRVTTNRVAVYQEAI